MEIEVMVPVPAMEFNFDSTCSSPYMTAPSSPQRFGNFFNTVPTTPSPLPSSYHRPKREEGFDFRGYTSDGGCEDFEFDFSGHLESTSLSAEELFDGGKIRPLRPQQELLSKDFDPFEAAIETSRGRVVLLNEPPKGKQEQHEQGNIQWRQRGRERAHVVHKKTRSLSPFRVSDIMFETEETVACNTSNTKSYVDSILSAISFPKGNGKWKLKDLFFFRSASESRVTTSEDSIRRKYGVLCRKEPEDVKNSSFRSTESVGSVSRRRGPVSAHELHYTTNRAVSEEMKRKTYLPYKHGLLGCLGFNGGAGLHGISRGIGSLTRG
ncbi:hypothetical protein like AT2G15760 [Hibiscus trionum]|uniref:Calmodulin-binding protein n=1 Tax=Hibiscus trionum TaxID=183268 RepID=A0A9W7JG68_HIBTR|nr:hypothetical protein like AT2G15760 [Hibiscus trionum]